MCILYIYCNFLESFHSAWFGQVFFSDGFIPKIFRENLLIYLCCTVALLRASVELCFYKVVQNSVLINKPITSRNDLAFINKLYLSRCNPGIVCYDFSSLVISR